MSTFVVCVSFYEERERHSVSFMLYSCPGHAVLCYATLEGVCVCSRHRWTFVCRNRAVPFVLNTIKKIIFSLLPWFIEPLEVM